MCEMKRIIISLQKMQLPDLYKKFLELNFKSNCLFKNNLW